MAEPGARLILLTPVLLDAAAFAPRLAEACAAGGVAAVIARLAAADERSLVKDVKILAPAAQDRGAALIVSAEGEIDLAMVAARGGADGIHIRADLSRLRDLKERLKGERSVGVGGIRSKDDAMSLGEAGADYLLFGEPRPDGSLPALPAVLERASWWAEIFEPPCIVFAPTLAEVPACAATGAEFVALGDGVWNHPDGAGAGVSQALSALPPLESAR